MNEAISVGLLGLGEFLPEKVRTNQTWTDAQIADWQKKRAMMLEFFPTSKDQVSETRQIVLDAFRNMEADPFIGVRERRMMPEGMNAIDMQEAAAKLALERAGVSKDEISFVLVGTICPDAVGTNEGAALHHRMQLPIRCLAIETSAACNAFIMQLELARALVASGAHKYGLVVQSTAVSRFLRADDPMALWQGDCATAQVVGAVEPGRGLRAWQHRPHGEWHKAVHATVPGKRWFDEGKVEMSMEPIASIESLFTAVRDARLMLDEVLAQAGMAKSEIDFYAGHQGQHWMQKVVQQYAGLSAARSIETFSWSANVSICNVPLILSLAVRDQLIRAGSKVALFGGGGGLSWSAAALHWQGAA